MKLGFFFAFFFAVSSLAHACPNLAGSYLCKMAPDEAGQRWVITQKVQSGVTTFDFKIDGKEATVVADGSTVNKRNYAFSAVCMGSVLSLLKVKKYDNSEATLSINESYTKQGGDVVAYSDRLLFNKEGGALHKRMDCKAIQ